jgi:cyclic pyranopterin phosphate synthase
MSDFTHFDARGNARMVDVTAKDETARTATAKARVTMAEATARRIREGGVEKGDVLSVARLAGIMGAKRTPDLIPLCHPLSLSSVEVELALAEDAPAVEIAATCKIAGKTGVEMEALTACSVAALTVYDMCKAVDKTMTVTDLRVTHKSGGKSGTYEAA